MRLNAMGTPIYIIEVARENKTNPTKRREIHNYGTILLPIRHFVKNLTLPTTLAVGDHGRVRECRKRTLPGDEQQKKIFQQKNAAAHHATSTCLKERA